MTNDEQVESSRAPTNVVIAGSFAQAKEYARHQGWTPRDWLYVHQPQQVYGLRGFTLHRVGTWYERGIDRGLVEELAIRAKEVVNDNE